MEVPDLMFGATVFVILFKIGFHILDEPEISNPASPNLMSFFKLSLVIFACRSSIYALKFSPQLKASFYGIVIYTLLYNPVGSLLSHVYFYIFTLNNFINFFFVLCDDSIFKNKPKDPISRVLIHLIVGSSIILAGEKTGYYPCLLLCFAFVCSASWFSHVHNEKKYRLVKFSVGILGNIFFHGFFRFSSFKQVVAFFFLTAAAWVANRGLLQASDEFGISSFMIGNLIVGFSVLGLGLWLVLWIAYGSSMVLFGMSLYIERFRHQGSM